MAKTKTWTLATLAAELGGTFEGPADLVLTRPAPAEENDPSGVGFAESDHYLELAEQGEIGAVIVSQDCRQSTKPLIRVAYPRMAFGMLLGMTKREVPINHGIHETAVVHPDAQVDETASIGAYVVIERGATVAAGAKIYPFCFVGEDCSIGADAVLLPHAVLVQEVEVGARSIINSGAVLGADGFGFIWDGSQRRKVPQVGFVKLGTDVEIGANTTIDRATAGSTKVGNGTKLDNLIQIGHNCEIGEHAVLAGMCGISGSTKIGSRTMLGGGVGTNDHIKIADDVVLGGRSGVDKDITEPGEYFGTPARPVREALRTFLIIPKLPEIYSRLRKVEKKVGL